MAEHFRIVVRVTFEVLQELGFDLLDVVILVSDQMGLPVAWNGLKRRMEPFQHLWYLYRTRRRSVVRLIGTLLPLKITRPHFLIVEKINIREYMAPNSTLMNNAETVDDDEPDSDTWSEIRSSTPVSLPESAVQGQTSRIAMLEDELAKLREQISFVFAAKDGCSDAENKAPERRSRKVNCPPPPPPLPPPNFHKNATEKTTSCVSTNQNLLPNMREVLKDIGNVKLRQIERSPGGTPVRQPLKLQPNNDAASIIAVALKKRFIHAFGNSPELNTDPGSDRSWTDSCPNTPTNVRLISTADGS